MYPQVRLDALGDAIFGVAMTLLVLDLRLPEDFHPRDGSDVARALVDLLPKVWPYVLSFGVLGFRWLSNVQSRGSSETASRAYATWWLVYLLLITFVPFATMILGRHAAFAPAIWLYAGTTILIALVAFRLMALTPETAADAGRRERVISLAVLIASAVLAIALSFFDPRQALWALVFNFAAPVLSRWLKPAEDDKKAGRPRSI